MEDMINITMAFLRSIDLVDKYDKFANANLNKFGSIEKTRMEFIKHKKLESKFEDFYQRNYNGGWE